MRKVTGRNILLSFLLPVFILGILFFSLGLTPFGSYNLLISDMGTQYLPFFAYLREQILSHTFHSYSFINGMGGSVLGLYGYYLLSPFNLLFLLFPVEQITTAVSYLLLLKIGLISVSSYLYFHFTYQRDEGSMLVVSTIFSLSGYVSLYFTNIMWLDALIFFPMVMLGLQLLVEKKKIALYLFSLCLTIITNYYLGYMTCLFSVLYFVYLFIKSKTKQSFWEMCKEKKEQIKLFVFSSLCAGGLSGVVLVPSLMDMLRTNKSEMNWENFSLLPGFSWEITRQFFPFSVDFEHRLQHLPTIFVGLFLIFTVRYFFSSSFSKKEKWLNFSFLFVLFLSFWLPFFNTIWHMMQKPAGFPYRNAYMFCFFLLILGYESYYYGKKETNQVFIKSFLLAASCYAGLFLLSIFSNYFQKEMAAGWLGYSKESYVFIIILLFLFIVFVVLSRFFQKKWLQKSFSILFCFLLLLEVGVNFRMAIVDAPFGNQRAFIESTKTVNQWVKKIKKEDTSFYRINNETTFQDKAYNTPFNHYNDSFLFNFYGIPLYSSTLNEENRQFLKNLGLYSKNERRISYAGETKVTNLLLDIKYCLTNEQDEVLIQENPEALGIGFAVNKEILKATPRKEEPLRLQNKLLQRMTGKTQDYLAPLELKYQKNLALDQMRFVFEAKNTGELYADLTRQPIADFQLLINGQNVSLSDNEKSTIHHLGHVSAGDQIQLDISGKKTLRRFQLQDLQILDEQAFEGALRQFQKEPFEVTHWDDGYVEGRVHFSDDQLLLLSIPYHENWHAKVDDQSVEIHEVMNGLIAIKVPSGKHRIVLNYQENSIWIGLGISLLAVVATAVLLWWNGKKRVKVSKDD